MEIEHSLTRERNEEIHQAIRAGRLEQRLKERRGPTSEMTSGT
jgi:hypothetical protein